MAIASPATTDASDAILRRLLLLVQGRVTSSASKAKYGEALEDFIVWYQRSGAGALDRATVLAYRSALLNDEYAPATINQRLTAVRALAEEAGELGLLDIAQVIGISRVRGVSQHGRRAGNWLTHPEAQRLLNAPDSSTIKGARDRAILAVLLGCGLRRTEVALLETRHIQQREGRWVVVDLVGKGRRVRSVPMPNWTKAALDVWLRWAPRARGRVFRSLRKGGRVVGTSMTDQAVADVVREYAAALGMQCAAHDLRRTFAKLALKGGARVEQIQFSLGHASIQTTERYLGVEQDLIDAPCDRIELRLVGLADATAKMKYIR